MGSIRAESLHGCACCDGGSFGRLSGFHNAHCEQHFQDADTSTIPLVLISPGAF